MENHGRDDYLYEEDEMPLYSKGDGVVKTTEEENKYRRTIYSNKGEITGTEIKAEVDVYDVLDCFNVTCPALQHLTKKALCVGIRGHKNQEEDLKDIIKSAKRALELYEIKKRQI